jgi:hypothetical protein
LARLRTLSAQILEVMRSMPECRLDDLALTCREYPWQAIFIEVNHLSREGRLRLTIVGTGACTVRLVARALPGKAYEGPLLTREKTMKKDNEKSQKGCNDQKSDTLRKWGSARVPQPISARLTCSETQLEALMSEGEST